MAATVDSVEALFSAVRTRLAAHTGFTAALAAERGDSVFAVWEWVPPDGKSPYLALSLVSQTPMDTMTGDGEIVSFDVHVFALAVESADPVRRIGHQVRAALHHHVLALGSGWRSVLLRREDRRLLFESGDLRTAHLVQTFRCLIEEE